MKRNLFRRGADLLRPRCVPVIQSGRSKSAPLHGGLLLTLLAPTVAFATLTPDNFHWSRPVEGAPVAQTTVVAVPFDADVFTAAADDFRDVRLLSDASTEIPRAVEKMAAVRQHTNQCTVASKLIALRELPDNCIEAEFELTATNAVADGFTLATPLKDFQHNVKVEGCNEAGVWTTLVAAAPLFDYTRYMDLRQLAVKLPANTLRRFRLTISNVTEEQAQPWARLMKQTGGGGGNLEQRTQDVRRQTFRVDRVNFWRNQIVDGVAEEARRAWPLTDFKVERDDKGRATLVTIQTGRLPLNRLTLEMTENNFNRPVTLQVPTIRHGVEAWSAFASGRFLRIELPGFAKRELEINFGERRAERIRLVLHDGDNPPLTIRAITGSGPIYRALWLAEPGRSYRLLCGNEQLTAPNYDVTSVLALARRELKPVEWKLGTPVENKTFRPAGGPLGWLNSPWVFGAAIALMLFVLGTLLFRTAKGAAQQLNDKPHD
ncbi:MAG: hypothetical protein EPN23_04260 [Verrucomicrobia bacterium]|nr:MAG: hypothetical protein EPN23_04260 [Verrucomicrobiota bacterium]